MTILDLAMVAQRFQVQPVKADMLQLLLSSTLRPKGGFPVHLTPAPDYSRNL